MKVKDLIKILRQTPDGFTREEFLEVNILMPLTGEFDGYFVSPCNEECGVNQVGLDEDSEETTPAFMIVPHGFFEEKEGVPPEMN